MPAKTLRVTSVESSLRTLQDPLNDAWMCTSHPRGQHVREGCGSNREGGDHQNQRTPQRTPQRTNREGGDHQNQLRAVDDDQHYAR